MRSTYRGIITSCLLLVLLTAASAFAARTPTQPASPPALRESGAVDGPPAIFQMGDTTWVQVHSGEDYCPGDPDGGHGGEATGGPDGSETWCLEGGGGAGDSCGSLPPYDTKCLWHEDRRAKSSDLDINYWHVDQYRADQSSPYTGTFSLWCGSGSVWDGEDIECGTWYSPPGYGNDWNCIAEVTLPALFSYAQGCTLQFDVLYDVECNCDFLYCEYYNGETWERLADFTSTSNSIAGYCGTSPAPTTDYFGNTDDHDNPRWQPRTVAGSPAFSEFIPGAELGDSPGFTWAQVTTGDAPPMLIDHDMAYDSARGVAVIFGGGEDDQSYESRTYEWEDTTWTRIYPATSPSARRGHQLVYFPDSSHTVLFGGYDGHNYFRDTWVWDGTDWEQKSPATRPPRRWGHGMTYDAARNVIVMFGGEDDTGYLGDTWEWDGTNWTEITTVDSPDARVIRGANGLAYDPVRGVTVLFGGETAVRKERDTWEYNGVHWTEVLSSGPMQRRYRHGLAYHPDLGGVVMYGGEGEFGALYDTWLWNGTTWTELHPAQSTGNPISHAMIYDYSTGILVLQGGGHDGSHGRWPTYELRMGEPLRLRWRFVSDETWSDADFLNTDGGAWIDNVRVDNASQVFTEDFEVYPLDPDVWSFPEPEGVMDAWYMVHDPDPLYEGGDGDYPSSCATDSSVVYRARPEAGFPMDAAWRNGWYTALTTPAIAIQNTGCAVQYDRYFCAWEITCDRMNTEVRFHDAARGTWCPWIEINGCVLVGGCSVWELDVAEDVSTFYGAGNDSMQFAWTFVDQSREWDFCRGKHAHSDFHIDNISVGFFDGYATQFSARPADLLHDTFQTGICGHNSYFDEYNPDTLTYYSGGTPLPWRQQFVFDAFERDGVATVEAIGSINDGGAWVSVPATLAEARDPGNPDLGGTYCATFCPGDFGLGAWDESTDLWYYARVTDDLAQVEYFPATADPGHPGHTGTSADYFSFSVLPLYPPGYEAPRLLLVDGYSPDVHDVSPCLGTGALPVLLAHLYGQALEDAGYTYDLYEVYGAGGSVHIHPTDYSDYDAIVWFTGIGFNWYDCLFDKPAQEGIRDYLGAGGKAIICGDAVSWAMGPYGENGNGCDSLGGEFLSGVLGADFLEVMAEPVDRPMLIFAPEESVSVFGMNTAVNVDTLRLYRECPDFRPMSWIRTEAAPPAGYTAARLLRVANPDVAEADAAVYVEYQGAGQCVFCNFDLTGTGYCDAGAFAGAWEDGRIDLLRTVLEDIFGLPADDSGVGGRPRRPDVPVLEWALHQNMPNPARGHTEIRYDVASAADVRISVYSATGRLVRTLVSGRAEPGTYSVAWDGRNSGGQSVAGGIYFYKIEAGGFAATRKMLLVR